MKKLTISLAALFTLAGAPALAGPVILGGDDLTDHGSRTGTTLHNGWYYIQVALENLAPAVTRPDTDWSVALLGSASNSSATSANAGAAYFYAVPNAAQSTPLSGVVRFYDGAAAINGFFASLAQGTVNPAIIVTAGTDTNNDLDAAEGTALQNNAAAIASFVNSGGGLLSHGFGTVAYGWLSALIPGVSYPSGCTSTTLSLTPAGRAAFPTLNDAHLRAGPCHSHFLNHGLEVLARDGSNRDIIIGGSGTVLPGQINLTPATGFAPPATSRSLTARVTNQAGTALAGIPVNFSVLSGPNAGRVGTVSTNISGNAVFTYTSNGSVGLDRIQASFLDPATGNTILTSARLYWDFDCQGNGVPDTCDLACGAHNASCAADYATTCGSGVDADGDGLLDACANQAIITSACDVPQVGAPNTLSAQLTVSATPPLSYAWSSNLSGDLGNGSSLNTAALPAGDHQITLEVRDAGFFRTLTRRTIHVGGADCNLNCVLDAEDIASNTSRDVSPANGVPDECDWAGPADRYPCDQFATGVVYAPAEGVYGNLLMEDLWPSLSNDYDFNDVALAWNFLYRVNDAGEVASIALRFAPLAMGGNMRTGLGLQLPVPAAAVRQATLTRNGVSVELTPSATDADFTAVLSGDLREYFEGDALARYAAVNSSSDLPRLDADTFVVDIFFHQPVALPIDTAPHDVYIFRTANPAHEIHRPEYAGTSAMNTALFGTEDDGSAGNRRFVDRRGLPSVLVFPDWVPYAQEGVAITDLYPDIVGFASSGGASNTDFYLNNVVASAAYRDSAGLPGLTPPAVPVEIIDESCTAPIVAAGPDRIIDEGDRFTGTGTFSNTRGSTSFTATVDYGDGAGPRALVVTPFSFTLDHVYPTHGVYAVTVSVTNSLGDTGTDTLTVRVLNVAPSVVIESFSPEAPAIGEEVTLVGRFTDPGLDTWTAVATFGDASGQVPVTLNADRSFTVRHTWTSPGLFLATVSVTDGGGASGSATAPIYVSPRPPVLNFVATDVNLPEGGRLQRDGSISGNPGSVYTVTADYGDGTPSVQLPLVGEAFALDHVYGGHGVFTVSLTVQDQWEAAASATFTVTVSNVPPMVVFTSGGEIMAGQTYILTGRVTDPGNDVLTASVQWGDGASQALTLDALGQFSATHFYFADGTYPITVTASDGAAITTAGLSLRVTPFVCPTGYADCDGLLINGCEVDIGTIQDCGACGNTCPSAPNAVPSCQSGQCGLVCQSGYADCDGNPANGCEVDLLSATSDCGACGNTCGAAANSTQACLAGQCQLQCAGGFADCDGDASNGCEASLGSNDHCGGCGNACPVAQANTTVTCLMPAQAACEIACAPGFADCDGDPSNGCEASLGDNGSCGGCGNVCGDANAVAVCTGSACNLTCTLGFASCDGAAATGCETPLDTTTHCGACGNACPARANAVSSCAGGACGFTCQPGYNDCDGLAANGCETAGACPCPSGTADCDGDGVCESALGTLSNCGACGDVCSGTEQCAQGACVDQCSDGVQNYGESGVDCGGPCPACATCDDGVQNQGESGVDCGGPCPACATCDDGVQNQGEAGIDCGGPCPTPCQDDVGPVITLLMSSDVVDPNVSVTFTVSATDPDGVASVELTVGGVPVTLNGGVGSFTPTQPGIYPVLVTATDGRGNVSTASRTLRVLAPGDTTPPTVALLTPAADATFSEQVTFTGTANDANLAYWELQYRLTSETAWTTALRGTTPVVSGTLGVVDPGVMENGIYEFRLLAEDVNGLQAMISRPYTVTGDAKVGNFSFTVVDLEVPVGGLPIIVERSYDSRVKTRRDFGVGWSLSVRQGRFESNRPSGEGWRVQEGTGFFRFPCDRSVELATHTTQVRLSQNERYNFRMRVTPTSSLPVTAGFCQVSVAFDFVNASVPGQATLEVLGGNLAVHPIGTNYLAVDIDQPNDVYQVESVRLTTPDGRRVSLTRTGGTFAMSEPNGNALTINSTGVRHSSGREILFTRDAQGRITQMTDPLGNAYTYTYDAAGDLVQFTDPTGRFASYAYNSTHHMLEMRDGSGRPLRRMEYDTSGRIVAVVDGNGNRTEVTHDLTQRLETVLDELGGLNIYRYDPQGNVLEHTDALGQLWTNTYDAAGRKLTSTDPDGRVTRQEYSANGFMTRHFNPLNQAVTWTNNAAGQPLTQTDADGRVTTLTYDARGNLATITSPQGNVHSNVFNASGHLTQETKSDGSVWNYAYDTFGRRTQETSPIGRVTTWTYDARGNKTSETRTWTGPSGPVAQTTTYAYDAAGRLILTTLPDGAQKRVEYNSEGLKSADIDPLGRRTEYSYDINGNVTRTLNPDGTEKLATFNARGQWLTRTDEAGRVTTATYDLLGRLTQITRPDGSTMQWGFDANGRITRQVDERGGELTHAYDAAGRLVSTTDALGNVRTQTNDAFGNITSRTDPLGNVMTYTYDGNMRRSGEILPDGTQISTVYDGLGRVLRRTDQGGLITHYDYDTGGRLTRVRDPANNQSTMTYDGQGNLLALTDANGNTTTYQYDQRGRLVGMVRPMGQLEVYGHDTAGNLITVLDASGALTEMAYDARNRLTRRTLPGGEIELTTYTPTGKRATVTDSRGVTAFQYDALDRLLARVDPDGVTVSYGYDAHGNVVTVSAGQHSVGYAYDALNRVAGVNAFGGQTAYTYDAAGNLTDVVFPNGVATSYVHDGSGRVLGAEQRNGSGALLAQYDYLLDSRGRRTGVVESHSGRSVSYGYDVLSRLTSETITIGSLVRQISYTYDANGNRLTRDDSVDGLTSYSYDANDRLVAAGAYTYTHDARGNLTERASPTALLEYAYDDRNRLASVDDGASPIAYDYDMDGHRIGRAAGSNYTRFVIDANTRHANVIAEADGAGAQTAAYAHGHGVVAMQAAGAQRFAHGDGTRSVRQLTDVAGAVTDTYDYDAFGRRLARTGSSSNPYGFHGEYLDEATGLYHLRARWLDVDLGRLLTVDPAQKVPHAPGTYNRYVFGMNDPVNRVDPSGEFSMVSVGIAGMWVSGLSIVGYGIGAYGYHTKAVDRERAMINHTGAMGVWGMSAALAIATSGPIAALSHDPGGSAAGGKADAVRHCTWNGIMAMVIGAADAEALATAHEDPFPTSPNAINDRDMDLFNNAMGRTLASPGVPQGIFRTLLSGIGALAAWSPSAGGCIGMLYAGQLVVLDQSVDPWLLVPSNTPHVP